MISVQHEVIIKFYKLLIFVCRELKQVGRSVSSLLMVATEEQRVTCGLKPAIHALETEPDEVLFCVLPQTRDPTTHIQAVLLQAFCYEQNIAIIKVGF